MLMDEEAEQDEGEGQRVLHSPCHPQHVITKAKPAKFEALCQNLKMGTTPLEKSN
jgi:hypothetical protein